MARQLTHSNLIDGSQMSIDAIATLRTAAENLLAEGRHEAAEVAFRELLAVEPKNIYGLMGLGSVARAAGDFALAEMRYRTAAEMFPKNNWPLFTLVGLMVEQQRWDDGEAIARQSFSIKSDDFYTAMALGRLRRERNDAAGAADAFLIACRADPKHLNSRLDAGVSLEAVDRLAEAEAIYREGLADAAPKQQLVLLRKLIGLASRTGDHAAKIDWLRRAIDVAPDDSGLKATFANESVALARRDTDKSAVFAALEAAHRLVPENVGTTIELADAHVEAGRLDEASTLYRHVLAIKPQHLMAQLGLGGIERRRGQHQAALQYFEKASAENPRNSWARFEIARTLRLLDRLDEAEVILHAFDEADLNYPQVLATLAHIARDRGDHARSLSLLKHAASRNAAPITFLVNAANAALRDGDTTMARDISHAMAERDPKDEQSAMLDGRICRALSDREGARAAFMRATELAPDSTAPLVELIAECRALGQSKAADEYLERLLAIDPENLNGLLQLAGRFSARGEFGRALNLYEQAITAHPTKPWPYLQAAQLLSGQGRIEDACQLIEQGRGACGASASFDAREANLLQEVGFLDRAREILEPACRRYPNDVWLWTSRAMLAIVLGDFQVAERSLNKPPSSLPADAARILQIRAKLEEARWCLESATSLLARAAQLDPENAGIAGDLAKLALFRFDLFEARRWLGEQARLQRDGNTAAGRSINITQSQLGQIYDEFAIQPRLIGTLAALGAQPTWSRMAGLLETVSTNPDATAAALALTIGLRRIGAFSGSRDKADADASTPLIPREICQYWDTAEPPPDVRTMIDSWITAHPTYGHTLFNDQTAAAYLAKHAQPGALNAFMSTRDRAQRADIFRLAWLYANGGIYIDADDRCRGPLEPLLPSGKTFVAFQEDYGSIANNFLAVAPQHPIIKRALDLAIEATIRGDREIVWLSTGPGMLTRAFAQYLAEHADRLDDTLRTIAILERHEVRAALVPYCQAAYKRTARHWQNLAFPTSGSVTRMADHIRPKPKAESTDKPAEPEPTEQGPAP